MAQKTAQQNQSNGGDGALENLLTPDEVCALLRIKKQRLYEWVHFGRIPCIKVGGLLRFSHGQIKQWLEAHSSAIIRDDETSR